MKGKNTKKTQRYISLKIKWKQISARASGKPGKSHFISTQTTVLSKSASTDHGFLTTAIVLPASCSS